MPRAMLMKINIIPMIKEVRIEVTNYCEYKCSICPREKLTRSKGIISFELFKKIVDEAIKYGVKLISLCGFGEAFCDPELIKKTNYIKSHYPEIKMVIGVSGLYLKNKSILKYGFDAMRFSFNDNMINDNFEIDHQFSKKITEICLVTNGDNIYEFINRWKDKVKYLSIWRPHNWANGRNYRHNCNKEIKGTCGRPFQNIMEFTWDGKLRSCPIDFNCENKLGDISNSNFIELYYGSKMYGLRKAHSDNIFDDFPICISCEQRRINNNILMWSNRPSIRVGKSNSYVKELFKGEC
jgi:hypothetical protein